MIQRTDSERLARIKPELEELYALIQVLRSAVRPHPETPVEPVQALAPLVDKIDQRVRAAVDALNNEGGITA
jgi:hypothetical protein